MRLRISPSKLEQFRLFVTEAYFGTITKEKVIDYLKGLSVPTRKMDWGTAFHAIIENGPDAYLDETGSCRIQCETGIIELKKEEVQAAIDYRNKYPSLVHEVVLKNTFNIDEYNIDMFMRIDALNGIDVHEIKTTDRAPNLEKYQNSMQWRCYALATGCRKVQYDVFQRTKSGIVRHKLVYDPYLKIRQDVENTIRHFLLFCKNEDLIQYIKPKENE